MGSAEHFIKHSGLGIAETAKTLSHEVFSKAYKWGGKTKDGFDCSGFVAHVFSDLFPNIGIVVSDKLWIGAQSKGVREVQLNNPYWSSRPHYFRRYKNGSPKSIQTSFLYHANASRA